MHSEADNESEIFKVVVNHEEQYSIWPVDRDNALGWSDAGKSGSKAECLAYIKEVWTDMRPLSLRKKMKQMAVYQPQENDSAAETAVEPERRSLLTYLSEGDHPVEVSLRPEKTVRAFQEGIDRKYVHIKFTDTKGGTELGVPLDPGSIDLSHADFEKPSGTVHLEGQLTLDYTKCRCIADIELETLTGRAHLQLGDPQ